MDFSLSAETETYRAKIHEFVESELLPLEKNPKNFDAHEMIEENVLHKLRVKAKKEGLWAFQMPTTRGGVGLNNIGMAACYEEMARSPFGPVTFNCAAPDDGNMMVLEKILPEK